MRCRTCCGTGFQLLTGLCALNRMFSFTAFITTRASRSCLCNTIWSFCDDTWTKHRGVEIQSSVLLWTLMIDAGICKRCCVNQTSFPYLWVSKNFLLKSMKLTAFLRWLLTRTWSGVFTRLKHLLEKIYSRGINWLMPCFGQHCPLVLLRCCYFEIPSILVQFLGNISILIGVNKSVIVPTTKSKA